MTNAALSPYDRDQLRRRFRDAKPFPWVVIDGFLEPGFAREVVAQYPSYQQAESQGFGFNFVNEKRKIQVSDSKHFEPAVTRLNNALHSESFLADLEYITGIDGLLGDETLAGGGIHVTGARGRLDVHVDFNYSEENDWHRRLNILLYLNPGWQQNWGGAVEFWDERVRRCEASFSPVMNRCVLFETSHRSYHGVQPVTCPDDGARKSFAAYYYTKQAPKGWTGEKHSTVFRARPSERFRGAVLMPLEKARRVLVPVVKDVVKRAIGRR